MLMRRLIEAVDRLRGRFDFEGQRKQQNKAEAVNMSTVRPPKRKRRR